MKQAKDSARPARLLLATEFLVLRASVLSIAALITIVHNYGPAGSGVILFFGCAAEAAHLLAMA